MNTYGYAPACLRGNIGIFLAAIAVFFAFCPLASTAQEGQEGGRVSGSLQANANFFIRDSLIGAANTPQYDRQLYGAESWLNLQYSNWGFDFGLRFDLFNNSNLLNPTDSYTAEGIGNWFVRKKLDKLGIQAGYIYDQIGSGIIFRAYEERPQLLDNALIGLKLSYDLAPDWQIRAFTGRQKQQFDTYRSVIRGLSVDGFIASKSQEAWWSAAPGFGVVSRTLDDLSMNNLVATLNTYSPDYAFVPKYNAYAFSLFNTFSAGGLSWYVEGAYKTKETVNDAFAETIVNGDTIIGDRLINKPGTVVYSTLSYARQNLGLTLEVKRTDHFSFRTRPQEQLNRGMLNYLPPMTRVNTYRLTSRYNAATQEIGEWAFQGDLRFALGKAWRFNLNASNIVRLDQTLLYRELYLDMQRKFGRKGTAILGIQRQEYNQEVYEFKPGVPLVQTVTPFLEWQYKLNERHSYRVEMQYMHTGMDEQAGARQDYGNWLFALAEFSLAPKWTFTAADMFNISPGKNSPADAKGNKRSLHFPRVDVFYNLRSTAFSLSYVKQVEGVVCTGGICRLEPAFSGVRFSVNSSF
ncbi:MAG: hypothetical protein KIPDCIKN_04046 [Haliscomenobacter sp.]|nr:hypothetical protein [Haliscomenobacter sp.]